MAEKQYQNEYTQFYVDRMQSGVLSPQNLQAYEQGVQRSIEQYGDDDTDRDTKIVLSIREALTVLQS